jgi:hypothetical protein
MQLGCGIKRVSIGNPYSLGFVQEMQSAGMLLVVPASAGFCWFSARKPGDASSVVRRNSLDIAQ